MGQNSVVSGYPKSIGILRVEGLSTRSPGFGASHCLPQNHSSPRFKAPEKDQK